MIQSQKERRCGRCVRMSMFEIYDRAVIEMSHDSLPKRRSLFWDYTSQRCALSFLIRKALSYPVTFYMKRSSQILYIFFSEAFMATSIHSMHEADSLPVTSSILLDLKIFVIPWLIWLHFWDTWQYVIVPPISRVLLGANQLHALNDDKYTHIRQTDTHMGQSRDFFPAGIWGPSQNLLSPHSI